MREFSVPIRLVRAAIQNTAAAGLDQAALLVDAGISPRLLEEADARVSVENFARLQTSTMLAMKDEGLGYYRRRIPIGTWVLMCHAVSGSATLREALKRYCRYFSALDIGFHLSMIEDGDTTTVRFERVPPDWDADIFLSERALYKCHRYSCWLVQEALPLTDVALAHPRPPYAHEYRDVFLGAPVSYDQPHTQLSFSTFQLDKPVHHDEVAEKQFLRSPAFALLAQRYDKTSWTMRVKQLLRKDLSTIPGMKEAADMLHVHPQSLRRRLAEEGMSFKQIVDDLHRDTALHFLGKRGMSVEEVAFRAGFSETSTFIRAFKRWTGVTPYVYRKGL